MLGEFRHDLADQRPAFRRRVEFDRALVVQRHPPPNQPASRQGADHLRHVGAFDHQGAGQDALPYARVDADGDECRIFAGSQIPVSEALIIGSESFDLREAKQEAGLRLHRTEVDGAIRRR